MTRLLLALLAVDVAALAEADVSNDLAAGVAIVIAIIALYLAWQTHHQTQRTTP